jgi:rhomboid protease GluP
MRLSESRTAVLGAVQDRFMSQETYHPLEAILRMCDQAAPAPWYYRAYSKTSGVDPEHLVDLLELLWLEGLVQKAPGTPETGPGVTLTPLGQEVVQDPEALRRLREGEPVREGDAGAVVRQTLRGQPRPVVTQMLVAANLLVFAYGALLASKLQPGLLSSYLSGMGGQALLDLLRRLGSLSAKDLVAGEWWRLMTTTFLHGGVLHIGLNMYTLYAAGGFVEQTWGRWRYLLIYLVSGWVGSCLAMTYQPDIPCVGASGAICGVLAAEGVWVLLYGRYLPRNLARRGRSQLFTTLVLMVFISLFPRVSGWAHLGGALGGAAAALALHFQRFGSAPLRVAGVLALIPLPWVSWAYMHHVWKTRPPAALAREEEKKDAKEKEPPRGGKKRAKKEGPAEGWPAGPFYRHHADPVYQTCLELEQVCFDMPIGVEDIKKRRGMVKQTLEAVARLRKTLIEQRTELEEVRPDAEGIKKARRKTLELIEAGLRLCDREKEHLNEPTAASERRLQEQFDKLRKFLQDFRGELKALRGR